ncbi:unnamed protein product [Bemisia tabaci]|uniref:Uncharacterized protein n=1 Tax=Bemisia tabaci TaxID=7038 RepID=A0A9P0AF62_BEMTA|nr:PREDICTED: uncharacterized protein LOC109037308 [Bemisia tabaci]CAH0390488.1 unnamed protein product [Bemisia tabaci]
MISIKYAIALLLSLFAAAMSLPTPDPSFWPKHTHYIIHVPYEVHTVHKHHYHKVPVYIKSHDHGWDSHSSHGWDWD